MLVPRSVANGSISPPLLLQYGHGLFGSQQEVETGYLKAQADAYGYILLACDWWGMAEYDVPSVVAMIDLYLSDFNIISDRLTQGMVNAHVLMQLMKVGVESGCGWQHVLRVWSSPQGHKDGCGMWVWLETCMISAHMLI